MGGFLLLLFFEFWVVFFFYHPGDSNVESEFRTMTMPVEKKAEATISRGYRTCPRSCV